MIHASHDRGNITISQLFGLGAPICADGRPPVPAHLFDMRLCGGHNGRSHLQAQRMDDIVARLKACGAMSVKDLSEDYGIRSEAMHKIIVQMHEAGRVRVMEGSKRPMLWEASDDAP